MVNQEHSRSPIDRFQRALALVAARVFTDTHDDVVDAAANESGVHRSLAVAYSDGLDSSVLLSLASDYAIEHGIELWAFHVHHGLSTDADEWLDHCRSEAERLNVRFDSRTFRSIETARESKMQLGQNVMQHLVRWRGPIGWHCC